MRKYLFDENDDIANLKKPHYEHFSHRLHVILQEYWIQQLMKLHDPAGQNGHENVSIPFIIERGDWDASTLVELVALKVKMAVLARKLKGVRNKILSHNDLTTAKADDLLGHFDQGDDAEYFKHLIEFASTVREAALGEPFLYDDKVQTDVACFMDCFNRGMRR